MKKNLIYRIMMPILITMALMASCQPAPAQPPVGEMKVLAVETFLADITQNVAGSRAKVDALIPLGLDPHAFEPTPGDVVRLSEARVLVVNGAGFEHWLENVLANAKTPAGGRFEIEAARGLTPRQPGPGEVLDPDEHKEGDPHYWLDPTQVIQYVEQIRAGLSEVDPAGKEDYTANAAAYTARLKDLDAWIRTQVDQIPAERRLLVTNHESFGYFADRYGFKIIGTVIPSVSTGASPSAQQLAALVDAIRRSNARAIFLETGSNPQLANQVAQETNVKVVTDLYTHSITAAGGPAPTYIDMMRANVNAIVGALK
jgi:ABC-type Zn uptake system ZnuABC Zn-binding protein ZnuA